jgi:hypothetical protein
VPPPEDWSHLAVDPACPVDWAHPLARGLVGWWAAVPNSGWRGGLKTRDLVRGGRNPHDATLTNGAAWAGPAGRPGGHGSVALDGSNDYVSLPFAAFSPLTRLTVAMWVRPAAATGGGDHYYWDASTERLRLMTAFGTYDGLGGAIQVGGTQTTISVASGVGAAVGKWTFLALTYDGATFALYADGKVVGTPASVTGNLDWASFSDSLASWGATTSGSAAFAGNVDSLMLYDRGLPAAGVARLHAVSRRGYPGLLNRLAGVVYSTPPAAGGGATGTLAVTLGGVTCSATGAVAVQGQAAVTLGSITASAAGTVAVAGTLGVTLGPVGVAASGTVAVAGALGVTLDPAALAAAGAAAVTGSLSVTLGGVSLAAAGQGPGVTAALAVTLGPVTLSAAGTVTTPGAPPVPVRAFPAAFVPVVGLDAAFVPVVVFPARLAVDIPVSRENHWRGARVAYRFDIDPATVPGGIVGWAATASLYDRRDPSGVVLKTWPVVFDTAALTATLTVAAGDTNDVAVAQGWLEVVLSTGEPIAGVHFAIEGPPLL